MIDRDYVRAMATCATRTRQHMMFAGGVYGVTQDCRVEPGGIFYRIGPNHRRAKFINLLCHEGKPGLTKDHRRDIIALLRDANTRR